MLKNDRWIREQAHLGMITPFQPQLVRHLEKGGEPHPVLSFGCSSFGYDLRLSPKEFLVFRHVPGTVMDPKRFNPANLEPTQLHQDADGEHFILPAHSYGLGVALEKLRVPHHITVICLGKSTYARMGIILNATCDTLLGFLGWIRFSSWPFATFFPSRGVAKDQESG